MPGGGEQDADVLGNGADLLLTGMNFEDDALPTPRSIATFRSPRCISSRCEPTASSCRTCRRRWLAPLPRLLDWVAWRGGKKVEDVQRRELGLPAATRPWPGRITQRGSLEIQAYDEGALPRAVTNGAKWNVQRPPRRPFVGALTMELPTDTDEEVAAWIAVDTSSICFGFGSVGARICCRNARDDQLGLRAAR